MNTYTFAVTETRLYTVEADSLDEALENLGDESPNTPYPESVKVHLTEKDGRRLSRKRLVDHY